MIQVPRLHLSNLVEDGQTSTPHWRKVIAIHASLSQMTMTNPVRPEGVMVAGGREGLVGVAGLLLGGGVSLNVQLRACAIQ